MMPTHPTVDARRVLVTGASGLLGCSLVPALNAAGHEVVTTAHVRGGLRSADLRDWPQTLELIRQTRPDAVVHLAAGTNVDECERDPQLAYALNVLLVENLIRACVHEGTSTHFIQVSTDHVYDGDGCHPEDQITIRNYYGMSKLAGEHAALRAHDSTVLRVNFVGKSLCPGRPSFSDWIVDSLKANRPLTVFDDVWFSPLRIETLAQAICHVLVHPAAGVFNLGAKGAISKAALARELATGLQLSADQMRLDSIGSRSDLVRRPRGMAMDSSRFEKTFNYPLPSVEAEVAGLCREYLNAV